MPTSLLPNFELKDLINGLQWILGTLGVAALFLVRLGKKAGKDQVEEQQRYQQLREDVDFLKEFTTKCITGSEHIEMQRLCRSDLEHLIDNKINNVVLDIRDELNTMNSNICRLMGAMNVQPIEHGGKGRRKTD